MPEPLQKKAKNNRTGEEVILFQHPDGSWKRTPPPRQAVESDREFTQTPGEALTPEEQTGEDAANAVGRTDFLDKVFAPIGAMVARATIPELPINQPQAPGSDPGSDIPRRPLSPTDPMAALTTPAAAEANQDMRAREARSPRATMGADITQALVGAAATPAAQGASLATRVGLGAAEGALQGAPAALGAEVPGKEDMGDAAAGAGFGGLVGGVMPLAMAGLQKAGRGLYNMARQDPLIDRAFSGGAEPAALSRGGIKPSPKMEADGVAARAIKPGAAGAEKAYGDLTDMVLPKVAADVSKALNGAEAATSAAVAKYPNLRVDTMPLRNEINNALSRMVGDITPEAAAAGVSRASKVAGVEPYTDLASQGPESDLAKAGAEEFRQMAKQLLRQLPADESTVVGQALRGSGAERKLASMNQPPHMNEANAALAKTQADIVEATNRAERVAGSTGEAPRGIPPALNAKKRTAPDSLPDLTDDLVDDGTVQAQRTAQFTVEELVNQKRLLDQAGRQAQSLNQPENVRRYRALGDVVRKLLEQNAPDVAKVAQAEHEAFNQMEARLTQLGLPAGVRDIDVTPGSAHWQALHNKLVQDPLSLRSALQHLGPDATQGANQASAALATDQLRGNPNIEGFLKGAEAVSWKNPEAGALNVIRGLHPVRRGAAMKNLPNDSPSIRRGGLVGLIPTFQEGD